jgi:hypothetical protein
MQTTDYLIAAYFLANATMTGFYVGTRVERGHFDDNRDRVFFIAFVLLLPFLGVIGLVTFIIGLLLVWLWNELNGLLQIKFIFGFYIFRLRKWRKMNPDEDYIDRMTLHYNNKKDSKNIFKRWWCKCLLDLNKANGDFLKLNNKTK